MIFVTLTAVRQPSPFISPLFAPTVSGQTTGWWRALSNPLVLGPCYGCREGDTTFVLETNTYNNQMIVVTSFLAIRTNVWESTREHAWTVHVQDINTNNYCNQMIAVYQKLPSWLSAASYVIIRLYDEAVLVLPSTSAVQSLLSGVLPQTIAALVRGRAAGCGSWNTWLNEQIKHIKTI